VLKRAFRLLAIAAIAVVAIVAIDLIEHLSKDDFMTLLAESARVLRVDGSLILRYPNGDSPLVGLNLFNDITHVCTYTSNCMKTLARMHGFRSWSFGDEGWRVARDHRWFKVPLGWACEVFFRGFLRVLSREPVPSFSPQGWAYLTR